MNYIKGNPCNPPGKSGVKSAQNVTVYDSNHKKGRGKEKTEGKTEYSGKCAEKQHGSLLSKQVSDKAQKGPDIKIAYPPGAEAIKTPFYQDKNQDGIDDLWS